MNAHADSFRPRQAHGLGRNVWILLAGFVLAGSAMAQTDAGSGRRRGQYLRTEVLRTDASNSYSCTLAPTSGDTPALLFRRQERLVHHEVRIYEVVLEEKTTDAATGREGVSYRVSPGDEMRGETSTRETSRDLGPFANEPFVLNGADIRTDNAGLFTDTTQGLLKLFDDLGTNVITVEVRHRDLGAQPIRISRYLTLRWEGKRPDERLRLVQTDLLVALGADFEPVTAADRKGLQLRVNVPDTAAPGQDLAIRVTATNNGKRPVSCLVGRLFSRHPWCSGLNFYLGNVPPGATREFERRVRVPETAAPGPLFATIGLWDILGAMEGAGLPVTTRVSAASPAPPAQR